MEESIGWWSLGIVLVTVIHRATCVALYDHHVCTAWETGLVALNSYLREERKPTGPNPSTLSYALSTGSSL